MKKTIINNNKIDIEDMPMVQEILKNLKILCQTDYTSYREDMNNDDVGGWKGHSPSYDYDQEVDNIMKSKPICEFMFHKLQHLKHQVYQIHVINLNKIHLIELENFVEKVGKYILNVRINVRDIYHESDNKTLLYANMFSNEVEPQFQSPKKITSNISSSVDNTTILPGCKRACLTIDCCSVLVNNFKYDNIVFQSKRKIKIDQVTLKKWSENNIDDLLEYTNEHENDPYFKNMLSNGRHPKLITENNLEETDKVTIEDISKPTRNVDEEPDEEPSFLSSIYSKLPNNPFKSNYEDDDDDEEETKSAPDSDDSDLQITFNPVKAGFRTYDVLNDILTNSSKSDRKARKNLEALREVKQILINNKEINTIKKIPTNKIIKIQNHKTPIQEISALTSSLVNVNQNILVPVKSNFVLPIKDKIVMINIQRTLTKLQGYDTPSDLQVVCKKYPQTNSDYLMECRNFRILTLDQIRMLLEIYPSHVNDIWIDFNFNTLNIHWVGATFHLPFIWQTVGLSEIPTEMLTSSDKLIVPPNLSNAKQVRIINGDNNNNKNYPEQNVAMKRKLNNNNIVEEEDVEEDVEEQPVKKKIYKKVNFST